MFDFGNANEQQRQAISTIAGPLLITAGPGTGKTFTLVSRAIYLVQECGVKPEQILIATFTEKAAKELITRITSELLRRGIAVNVNDMYIGTFHSICLRVIKENLEFTKIKKNYRVLDQFDQCYVVFQNIYRFRNIPNIELLFPRISGSAWHSAVGICSYVNTLSEEMVDPDLLKSDPDLQISVMGLVFELYQSILSQLNLLDFAGIQTQMYELLKDNPSLLGELQGKLSYIMIDEYQDTNYVQEQIVFLLGGERQNICVVGDDDQGLYRFRGATIRNILEFPHKFCEGVCKIISIDVNYRSNGGVIDFYNKWMQTTGGSKFRFQWGNFRYEKTIKPYKEAEISSPTVIKLASVNDVDEWHRKILGFLTELKESGKLTDYNQIAFLFNSVKSDKVTALARYLENNGINVYSPRSALFFERYEIRLITGCLMLMFPEYVEALADESFEFLSDEHYSYYRSCIMLANEFLSKAENRELLKWLRRRGREHLGLIKSTDYAYSGLVYQMLEFEPFRSILDTDMSVGVVDIRPARNLALFSQIVNKFEYLHNVSVLDAKEYRGKKRIVANTELLFNLYLRLLRDGGISEYEDDSEYAPSGCVSFLTIHQSKGMEFPIVLVDSLWQVPRKTSDDLMTRIESKYFKRPAFEPYDDMKYFDFWRLYYTAFSRTQDLLVLTCNEVGGQGRTPSRYFAEVYDDLPSYEDERFDVSEFDFKEVKEVNLKDTFSFTSHITVYETCSLQYKFFKELEFAPVRVNAMLFGMLVHQTIEDIHKTALRNRAEPEKLITSENITKWFEANYSSLSKSERTYLAEPQRNAALNQVLRYAERNAGQWDKIQEAEVNVSLVKPDYIIEGNVDLIKGEGGTVEIVDFKSEKKPDIVTNAERLQHYRRQLHIYAHLVEERTGYKVSKMHIYYTGEEDSVPTITYPYTQTAIDGTIAAFDDTVQKILRKEYRTCADSAKTCRECDFRFYCKK